jgi:hypothetical protein
MTEQRNVARRKSEKFLQAISRKYADGLNDKDFVEVLLLICQLSACFGKRQEDRRLWLAFLRNLENIFDHFRQLWILGRMPGLVRLKKEKGRKNRSLLISVIEGWEIKQPMVGEPYSLFMPEGRLLQTSVVTRIDDKRIRTKNSTYIIEVIEEYITLSDFVESYINRAMNRIKHKNSMRRQKDNPPKQFLKIIK